MERYIPIAAIPGTDTIVLVHDYYYHRHHRHDSDSYFLNVAPKKTYVGKKYIYHRRIYITLVSKSKNKT